MSDFISEQLPSDLSNQIKLVRVGEYLKRSYIPCLIDSTFSVRIGIANSDILKILRHS